MTGTEITLDGPLGDTSQSTTSAKTSCIAAAVAAAGGRDHAIDSRITGRIRDVGLTPSMNKMAKPLHSPQSVSSADSMGVAVGQQQQLLGGGPSGVQHAIPSSSVPLLDTQQSPSKLPRLVVAENRE